MVCLAQVRCSLAKNAERKRKLTAVPAFTELASADPQASRDFLERVFGWQFSSVTMPAGDYLSYRTEGGGQGGVRATLPKEAAGSMNYVRVEDLDDALQAIKRSGGEIVLARVDVPEMGSFFWFRIPGGPVMACWQDAPDRKPRKE